MLAACNGVLQEIDRRDIYERHITGTSKRADVTDFFGDLARLSLKNQQRCFNSIVGFLKGEGKGVEHVTDRLLTGKRNYLSELKSCALLTSRKHEDELGKLVCHFVSAMVARVSVSIPI